MDLLKDVKEAEFTNTKEVEVMGKKIVLRELNVFEEMELEDILSKFKKDESTKFGQLNYVLRLLRYSIISINGEKLSTENTEEIEKYFTKIFSSSVIFKIFKEYSNFVKEQNKEINDFFSNSQSN